ncbi:Nucleotidyltransferase [Vibrio crassostreae]|nr:Nucleotidyltransferase [Vibrio crassostreae]
MSTSSQLSDDLKALGELLERQNVIKSSTPIVMACDNMTRNNKRCLIRGIELNNIKGDYVRGGEWDKDLDVLLTIDVSVDGDFRYEFVKKIIVNLEYSTLHQTAEDICKGSWHFDYHVDMEGTGEEEEYRFIHPHFHVHHGGHRVKELDSYGNMIILKNPRLMHHPLDALLAIDLVLSNFLQKREWDLLKGNPNYKRVMRRAQMNWWKPYYEQLGQYWASMADSDSTTSQANIGHCQGLNPHLIL